MGTSTDRFLESWTLSSLHTDRAEANPIRFPKPEKEANILIEGIKDGKTKVCVFFHHYIPMTKRRLLCRLAEMLWGN